MLVTCDRHPIQRVGIDEHANTGCKAASSGPGTRGCAAAGGVASPGSAAHHLVISLGLHSSKQRVSLRQRRETEQHRSARSSSHLLGQLGHVNAFLAVHGSRHGCRQTDERCEYQISWKLHRLGAQLTLSEGTAPLPSLNARVSRSPANDHGIQVSCSSFTKKMSIECTMNPFHIGDAPVAIAGVGRCEECVPRASPQPPRLCSTVPFWHWVRCNDDLYGNASQMSQDSKIYNNKARSPVKRE